MEVKTCLCTKYFPHCVSAEICAMVAKSKKTQILPKKLAPVTPDLGISNAVCNAIAGARTSNTLLVIEQCQ